MATLSVGSVRARATSARTSAASDRGFMNQGLRRSNPALLAVDWDTIPASEMTKPYDSRPDTLAHIKVVRERLWDVCYRLQKRGAWHDRSKLEEPELSVFNKFTPRIRSMTYGSPEYKAALEGMGEGLAHHYQENSHHPEHYPSGVAGMSLLDLVEMLCDWKAATTRHADGDLRRSLEINAKRFGISEQLEHVLLNTVEELGW